jgi:BirA family biotin operon repressor/biotin-[acetyl-CoA-carboxylase] ligase
VLAAHGGEAPPRDAGVPLATYDGVERADLARRLDAPRLALYAEVPSTQDVAHAWAASGAPDGAVVLADAQSGGRGRAGRAWASPPGSGVWLTAIVRPRDPAALEVLALRVGLELAEALAPLAAGPVGVKWPNDLLVGGRKLAGILVEARWRDGRAEWAAVGVGVNVRPPPDFPDAGSLAATARRPEVAAATVAAVRRAAAAAGPLGPAELARLAARDLVRGRRATEPVAGRVEGVGADGALLVRSPDGALHRVRQSTVTYAA